MPELPEVETTLLGIQPHIQHQMIKACIIRQRQLRWPIPMNMEQQLKGQIIESIERRGKYLIFKVHDGAFMIHLGMSGRLRILQQDVPPAKHDHVDIKFNNHIILRYTDPRRFGAILWISGDVNSHPLLAKLGIEPFDQDFTGDYLWQRARTRSLPIKSLIMENKTVVGIGNIYATEALFLAKIHPATPANALSLDQMNTLVNEIILVLRHAITQGGTTLKDFLSSDGKPGYFFLKLQAYGRVGLPCVQCSTPLKTMRIGQRSTCYCAHCQPRVEVL